MSLKVASPSGKHPGTPGSADRGTTKGMKIMAGKLTARCVESLAKRKGGIWTATGCSCASWTPASGPIGSIATRSTARSAKRASALTRRCRWPMRASSTPTCALVLKGGSTRSATGGKPTPPAGQERRGDVRRVRRRLSRPAGETRPTGQEPEAPAAMARDAGQPARLVPRSAGRSDRPATGVRRARPDLDADAGDRLAPARADRGGVG